MFLLETDVNANGDPFTLDGQTQTIIITAVAYGGGTVTIQVRGASQVWVTMDELDGSPAQYTADVARIISGLPAGVQVRATLTGATGADTVKVEIL